VAINSSSFGALVRYFFTSISGFPSASDRSKASKTARRLATTWGFNDGLGRNESAFFDQIELAPLPGLVRQPGVQRRLEPAVGIADDHLHIVKVTGAEPGQDLPPLDLRLRQRDAHAQHRPLALGIDADGHQHHTGGDLPRWRIFS
jgi:hypothetical protein